MVATRRASSQQTAPPPTQPAVARRQRGASLTKGGTSELSKIHEGDQAHSSVTIATRQSPHRSLLSMPSLSQLASPLSSSNPHPLRMLSSPLASNPLRTSSSNFGISDEEDSDGDVDLAPLSHAQLMDKLSSSLRSALRAQSGAEASTVHSEPQQDDQEGNPTRRARKGTGLEHEPEEEEEDAELDLDAGLQHLKWNPDVQVVNPRTASRFAQKEQQDLLAAGKEAGLNKHLMAPSRDVRLSGKAARKAAADTAGSKWYNLPATQITDEVKKELRLLRLRGTYDPKRFYKSFDESKFPKYFQVGTVVDSPLEWYGGRLTARQRKGTLSQEVMADPVITAVRKKRFNKLQVEASRFSKVKRRKTDMPRDTRRGQKPRH